ncbi:MAG: VWA domain-containing protein [Pedosphaera sp.]|nr:VWA domain-containing protein [Pedosphaera sp.]MSS99997.1 VWA domain-containing protein [Pedosphaera sp.]
MTTELRFLGEFQLWQAFLLAVGLGAVAAWIYRRDTRGREGAASWLLPVLRGAAVFLVVMMLSGPVLQHRRASGQTARVLLYVDASASMATTDEAMEPARKLALARKLGWIGGARGEDRVLEASDQLARARQAAEGVRVLREPAEIKAGLQDFRSALEITAGRLERLGTARWPVATDTRFRRELLDPAQRLSAMDPVRAQGELAALLQLLGQFEAELQKTLAAEGAAVPAPGLDDKSKAALERFDKMPRWQRLEQLLLGGGESLIERLAGDHHIELFALNGKSAELLWWPGADKGDSAFKAPKEFGFAATNQLTNLADPIRAGIEENDPTEKLVVVIFTDGQHNDGTSPIEMAKMLGQRGVQVHTIGIGTTQFARDMALLEVKAPSVAYPDANVTGKIIFRDGMPPGQPFTLRIEHEGRLVWESKPLQTQQLPRREVPFDFAIKEAVAAAQRVQPRDLSYTALPLALRVTLTPVAGEKQIENNTTTLRINAITQKPRVLLLDGRPRWEHRYLRNVLERDDRWEVNSLLAGLGGENKPWPRGLGVGSFPLVREELHAYQLIVFGDVPREMFRPEELQWLREFVEFGGGMIFLDGQQERLASYLPTALGPLFPVRWGASLLEQTPMQWRFRSAGGAQAPLALAADPAENIKLWAGLPGPRWVTHMETLPGAETLLELVLPNKVAVPALVFRRFGAGQVLYAGFDESWRWRQHVGDRHHQKFWNQISRWVMEAPYAVSDRFVSLDSGAPVYALGEQAEIRVRVRDSQGRPLAGANPEVALYRDGKKVSVVPLKGDGAANGVYRGRSAALAGGNYEVRVTVPGLPEKEMKARTEFSVLATTSGEMGQLHCDEELLRRLAFNSNGAYYREEDMDGLAERLRPLSEGKIVITETALWQSYWWFVPVALLLGLEWALRKRAGLL